MRLSPVEERFLRHWMYDEAHFLESVGPAKRLQLQHGALPLELATLIAAAIPDPADQEAAGVGPPPDTRPFWPWASPEEYQVRLEEARRTLASRELPAAS